MGTSRTVAEDTDHGRQHGDQDRDADGDDESEPPAQIASEVVDGAIVLVETGVSGVLLLVESSVKGAFLLVESSVKGAFLLVESSINGAFVLVETSVSGAFVLTEASTKLATDFVTEITEVLLGCEDEQEPQDDQFESVLNCFRSGTLESGFDEICLQLHADDVCSVV